MNKRISPSKKKKDLYTDVSFTCKSEGTTKWTFNGGILPRNARVLNNAVLHISRVTLRNGGWYECQGMYNNHQDLFIARALLNVYGKFFAKHSVVVVVVLLLLLLL